MAEAPLEFVHGDERWHKPWGAGQLCMPLLRILLCRTSYAADTPGIFKADGTAERGARPSPRVTHGPSTGLLRRKHLI